MARKKLYLEVVEVTLLKEGGEITPSYVVVLYQPERKKVLPIIIDFPVAYAIEIALRNQRTLRPLTHDLMKSVLKGFGIRVREVIISDFKNSIFYATIVCEQDGTVQEFDSRASDAIALALRFQAPIYVYASILREAGLDMQTAEEQAQHQTLETPTAGRVRSSGASRAAPPRRIYTLEELKPEDLKHFSDTELEELMEEAVRKELFEIAAWIRDELQSRRKQQGRSRGQGSSGGASGNAPEAQA